MAIRKTVSPGQHISTGKSPGLPLGLARGKSNAKEGGISQDGTSGPVAAAAPPAQGSVGRKSRAYISPMIRECL